MLGFLQAFMSAPSERKVKQAISIIIPFHNEKKHLPQLIESLNNLKYGSNKFEVILVNDCSTDDSEIWLQENESSFHFTHFIINLTKKVGKKTAIEKGMVLASFNRIVTTDADCTFHPKWLSEIGKSKGHLSIGITLKESDSFSPLHKFQEIESLLLAGITIGSSTLRKPILCSGANLVYNKNDFNKITPYESNKKTASGDDMFLLEAMLKHKKRIKVRIKRPVKTNVKNSWQSYLNQTARWAGKTNQLTISGLKLFSAMTFITNLIWIVSIVLWMITKENIFITLPIIKSSVDFLFLILASLKFKRMILNLYAPIIAIAYPFYLIILTSKILTIKQSWSSND